MSNQEQNGNKISLKYFIGRMEDGNGFSNYKCHMSFINIVLAEWEMEVVSKIINSICHSFCLRNNKEHAGRLSSFSYCSTLPCSNLISAWFFFLVNTLKVVKLTTRRPDKRWSASWMWMPRMRGRWKTRLGSKSREQKWVEATKHLKKCMMPHASNFISW